MNRNHWLVLAFAAVALGALCVGLELGRLSALPIEARAGEVTNNTTITDWEQATLSTQESWCKRTADKLLSDEFTEAERFVASRMIWCDIANAALPRSEMRTFTIAGDKQPGVVAVMLGAGCSRAAKRIAIDETE